MVAWLKQSTAADVILGPFVDSTDGVTAETALTISQADIRLSKNGAAFAQTNNATGATHRENGNYLIPLDTTDTNTLGRLRVAVNETGALPVWLDFHIVPANIWDSYFGADYLQVDVTQLLGTAWLTPGTAGTPDVNVKLISDDATAANNCESFFDGTGYAGTGNTIPTVTTTTNLTNERGKYANGAVWIGPAANTNTTSYTDGIITNPVSTIGAAKTIADALGLRRFEVIRTGAVSLAADLAGYRVAGVGWSLNTTGGSRDAGTSAFIGAAVIGGTFASTTGTINWIDCEFSTGVTIGVSNLSGCTFLGTLTLSTAGNYDFVDCASIVAGTSAPEFAIPAGTVNVSFRRWSGGITISGITSGTTISIDMVSGGTVTLGGADGNVQVRGMCSGITDNRTGSPTLGQNAALNRTTIPDAVWDEAISGHLTAGTTGAALSDILTDTGTAGVVVASLAANSVTASALATDAVAEIADGVWDEALSGHLSAGSTGEALNAAGAAGDPWTTILPGAYTGSQAGKIVSDILTDTAEIGAAGAGLTALATSGALQIVDNTADAIFTQTSASSIRTALGMSAANLDTQLGTIDSNVDLILDDTGTSGVVVASLAAGSITASVIATGAIDADALAADAATEIATAVLTTQMTESYRATNTAPTLAQAQFELIAHMGECSIASTTKTLKKLDGSTTAKTYTLNSATLPTSITEAT